MKYRIIKINFHNEYGDIDDTYFYVEKQVSIFGFTYWVKVKHRICEWGDSTNALTTFKTQELAQQFIDNILCPEVPRQCAVEEIVSYSKCK